MATATKALQDQLADERPPAGGRRRGGRVLLRRPQGAEQLPLPPAGRRDRRPGRAARASSPASADPPDADDPLTPAGRGRAARSERSAEQGRLGDSPAWSAGPGDRDRRPGRARLRAALPGLGHGVDHRPGVPRRLPLPVGSRVLRRGGAGQGGRADVVVVNTHLYGAHLASGGAVLPPHQVVVFDEAHEVEEVMTDSLGVEIGPGRFRALAAAARPLLDPASSGALDAADGVAAVGDLLQRVLRPLAGQRIAQRPCWGRAGPAGRAPRRAGRPDGAGPSRRAGTRAGRRPRPLRAAGRSTPGRRPDLDRVVALAAGASAAWSTTSARPNGGRRRRVAGGPVPAGPGPAGRRAPGRRPGPAGRARPTTRWPGWTVAARAPSLRVSPDRRRPDAGRAAVGHGHRRAHLGHRAARPGRAAGPPGRTADDARRRAARSTTAATPCCTWPSRSPTAAGPSPSRPSTTSSRS